MNVHEIVTEKREARGSQVNTRAPRYFGATYVG